MQDQSPGAAASPVGGHSEGRHPPRREKPVALYVAAALGAFFLTAGDLFTNGYAATTLKIAEVIKQHVYAGFDEAVFIIPALMLLACCLCWVYQPRTRVDAFGRGFALFAVLSVAAPYQSTSQGADITSHPSGGNPSGSVLGIGAAVAAEHSSQRYTATLNISFQEANEPPKDAQLIIRDPKTGKILGREDIEGPVKITAPGGTYEVEIEAKGYRRTEARVEILEEPQSYNIRVEKTFVPLTIQRLWAPRKAPLE